MLHMEALKHLPPEPWGKRMRRARELAGYTLDEAAAAITGQIITDGSTISRLEARPVAPTGPRSASQRRRAYCLAVLYAYDPSDFDLYASDSPGGPLSADIGWIADRAA